MVARVLKRAAGLRLWVQLVAVSAVAVAVLLWMNAQGERFADLWLTPDQQGRYLYDRLQFPAAAERFADPAWRGTAQYRAGLYADAAATFGRINDAVGFYNRGNAFMKGREYGKAITAYEQAVADAPDWTQAHENLALARYTLQYIERAREQSDTGDESELSADDVVFDNTQEKGLEMEITNESTLAAESAEKWMRSVDTETADFLRSRFRLEAAREGAL